MADSAFVDRLRARQELVGHWIVCDNVLGTEHIARLGYDYVCLDVQHGFLGYAGMAASLLAIDAGATSAPLVRVGANDPAAIGRALDAGAVAVIVPLINSAADAKDAVRACRYPPLGVRSYGPNRSGLRIGPDPVDANAAVACIVMIETAEALNDVEEICAVPGVDGVYIGPSDLSIALGAVRPGAVAGLPFAAAVARVRDAAAAAGIAAGFHAPSGVAGRQRLDEGFTFATVSTDLVNLDAGGRYELVQVRAQD